MSGIPVESIDLNKAVEVVADRVTVALDTIMPRPDGPEARLISAMRYAALGPGKRLRPFLCQQAGEMLNADDRGLLRVSCAIECIHAYSLIHDDLPSMDNDDLRRGRPTVHVAYDEATAILAGDALQALAYEFLSSPDTHVSGNVRSALIEGLAMASGARGMAGGQMIDMTAHDQESLDIGIINRMHRMKTGALIVYSVKAAGVLAEADDDVMTSLEGFAQDLGLVYQIVDDILDVEAETEELGKTAGKDERQGKANFVSMLGLEGAKERARRLAAQSKEHLAIFGQSAHMLHQTVDFIIDRRV